MARRSRSQDPRRSPDLSVEEATSRRDEGRIRVRNTTLWAVAATAVGTAVIGAGYAYAIPGSSSTHPAPAQPHATAPSGRVSGPPATGHPPTTAPGANPTTPGHRTTTAKPAKPTRPAKPPTSKPPKPSKPSAGLQRPAQPPAPTTQPPQTTTGGS